MVVYIYENHRFGGSRVALELEDQEAQIGSELRDFLMALRDSTMPLIAHVAIKSGRRSLCRHAVWLRVTDLSEEMVIFTSDEIPASFISCDHYQLDPVRENIAVEFQSQYLNQVRDREQWVAYFKGRVRKVYNEAKQERDRLSSLVAACRFE
jgi:hypothetical protein